MKIIISQDGQQVFTCGDCQIYNISTVEIPGREQQLFSVGVAGMSLGQFDNMKQAKQVLRELTEFLIGEDMQYKIPDSRRKNYGNKPR